jgi:hypothetical protein
MAAMIPMEDLRLLERLIEEEEDRIDVAAIEAAIAEGGEAIPYERVRKELGLDDLSPDHESEGETRPRRHAKSRAAAH